MKLLKQVKIFYASSTKEMQTQINVWLEENENILILKMLQSVTDDMGSHGSSIVITILYEE
jgi:NurA-like 5'-3' nuclease